MKKTIYIVLIMLLISCGKSKNTIPVDCKKNCLLNCIIEEINIDSISKTLNINHNNIVKLQILENTLNNNLKEEFFKRINDNDEIDKDLITEIGNLKIIKSKEKLKEIEIQENKYASQKFNELLAKKITEVNKTIINNEFGFFSQFKHMYNTLTTSEEELIVQWTDILKNNYQKIDFNDNLKNYEVFLDYKHKTLKINYNETDLKLINEKALDFKNIESTKILETNNKKLNNEIYDFTLDLVIGFIIWLILTIIFRNIVGRVIAENDKFYAIFKNGYSAGRKMLSKFTNKEYSSKNDVLFDFISNLAVDFFHSRSNQKLIEEYNRQKSNWSLALNSISFIVFLFIFVKKDIKLENTLEENLNVWAVKNININNKINKELNSKTLKAYEN